MPARTLALKKILLCGVVALLFLSVLSACASKHNTNNNSPNTKVTDKKGVHLRRLCNVHAHPRVPVVSATTKGTPPPRWDAVRLGPCVDTSQKPPLREEDLIVSSFPSGVSGPDHGHEMQATRLVGRHCVCHCLRSGQSAVFRLRRKGLQRV